MGTCKICGKNLGFFQSLSGNTLCPECKKAEQEKIDLAKNAAIQQLHNFLTKNLNAKTDQELIEWGMSDATKKTIESSAHSIKSDEKIFILCPATAKESKYIKSVRQNIGTSLPFFGLKGWRMYSSAGQSVPIYDYRVVGSGIIALTDKNIHLCALSGKPIKIPYNKIEGFHLYKDGLEVYHGTQKPTLFIFSEVDSLQSDVIGHIIDLYTR